MRKSQRSWRPCPCHMISKLKCRESGWSESKAHAYSNPGRHYQGKALMKYSTARVSASRLKGPGGPQALVPPCHSSRSSPASSSNLINSWPQTRMTEWVVRSLSAVWEVPTTQRIISGFFCKLNGHSKTNYPSTKGWDLNGILIYFLLVFFSFWHFYSKIGISLLVS